MRAVWFVAVAVMIIADGGGVTAVHAASLTSVLRRERKVLTALEDVTDKLVRGGAEVDRLKRERQAIDYELVETRRRATVLQERLQERRQRLRYRLRALYGLSYGGHLRLLVNARDEGDMLLRAAAVGRLLERDRREARLYRSELERLSRLNVELEGQERDQQRVAASIAREQTELEQARRKHRAALRRLRRDRARQEQLQGELSRAQKRLLTRVSRLERRVRRAGGFSAQRGRLPRPVTGPRVSAFGRAVDPQTGLSVVRSGVSFRPGRRAAVRAVHRGIVRVAREVPGYGKLVVVEHGDGYHSVYGFLAALLVEEGAQVWRGSAVGRAGIDPLNAQPATYFELRQRGQALDPVAWLRR